MKKNLYDDISFEEQPRPNAAVLERKLFEKLPSSGVPAAHPVVTVVTAVFSAIKAGRKDELLQCMDSVQKQTGTTIEHLIIDGASSDGTVELIRNYQNKNVPIRLLSESDSGIYDAMNRGIWLARGKYVIFLNSDDYYSNPSGLAESVKCLEESGADFSYAPVTVLSETTGLPVPHLISRPNINMIFVEMPFSHQSMMLRREKMREINGFDLRYRSGADYDSVLRMIFSGCRACFVPDSFVAFRLGGYSFVNVGQSQQEVGMIFSRLYKKYLGVELSPEEGRKIYLTKQGPKDLRKLQFPFARATFGDAIDPLSEEDNDFVPEKLLMLRYYLKNIKNQPGIRTVVPVIVQMLCSSPVLFCRFLLKYFRFFRKLGKVGAGKQAYLELLAGEQKKHEKMISSSSGEKHPSVPRLNVTYQDYWHTNGLFLGEPWGAWAGKMFSVFFNLPEEYIHQVLAVQVWIGGYVFPESPKRIIEITVNGKKIDRLTTETNLPQMHRFTIPADIVTSAALDIDFTADQVFTPKSLGHNDDTRELGISFLKLSIKKIDSPDRSSLDPSELQEIKVGFLNHFNRWWVGGITYFKNLFQAMDTTESPRLRPFIFPSPDELADCLMPYVSTFPEPASAFTGLDHLPTAADYHVDILSHLNGNQAAEGNDGIAWISDFQHVHLPEMFDEQEIAFRNHSFHSLIEQNRIVCLSSYDAMEDFKKYAPESAYKARCLHFVSIPEPAVYQLTDEESAEIRRNRQLPERYFYVPNQFWKHKNHITVLKAISILKKSGFPIHVVFSGNTMDARFPHYFEELEAFCKQEQIEENVHFLGLIPLKEVYFLMRNCLAMINPSRFEGWSSSVEEAKSIGKTMILSNLNVHYEQMPPHGIYFPVDDPAWLADLLKRAWSELKMGPDSAMEAKAGEELPRRIRQFGKDFQQIVLDALENKNSCEAAFAAEPDVSVITVIHEPFTCSGKEQLIRNMSSVAAQTGVSVEHLIVDNSSSCGIPEFLQPCLEKYNCRMISGADHGIYGAMNCGTIQAKGKYVSYLNQEDCYASEDFLKKSVDALKTGDFDFSYCSAGTEAINCFAGMPFLHQSMVFRRKALYSVAVFNDTLCCAGEYDLFLRLILSGKRGVQVASAGMCTAALQTTEPLLRECGMIYSRLYSKLGYAITEEEGCQLYQEKKLPKELEKLLQPYCSKAFGTSCPNVKELE